MKERYERCLDLYLCPRSIKQRITIDRNALLPELPAIAALCLENLELFRAGRHDAHTGLANRGVLMERLARETAAIRTAAAGGSIC